MKLRTKRLTALLLLVSILASFLVPAVFAADSAEEVKVVTYDFDLGASTTLSGFSGKALSNTHVESGKTIAETIQDYYADGKLNWKVEALADGLKASAAMFRAAPQGWRISASDGQWLAVRIKNPGAGTYELALKRGMSSASNGSVYILDGTTTDIPAAMAAGKALTEVDYSYEGDATVSLGQYTFGDAAEYIVVFTTSGRFYLSNLTMTEIPVEEPALTEVTYDFDLGASTTITGFSGKALSNTHVESGKTIAETIQDYYADGKLNWKVEALADGLKASAAMFRAAPQGWRISASDGQWLAVRIKNPGAGTYELALKRGMSYASSGSVYILDGSTTDIPTAMAAGKALTEVDYSYEGDATVSLGQYTFGDAAEYIVVFTTSGRFYLSNLTMTEIAVEEPEVTEVTYDFFADEIGLAAGDNILSEAVKAMLDAAYAGKSLNWTVLASNTAENVKQEKIDTADTGVAFEGLNAKVKIPGWVALKLKNPGEGKYNVDLSYYETKFGAAEGVAYLLPGSAITATGEELVTQIDSLIASGSQLGEAINFTGNRSNKLLTVANWATVELEASETEYVLVFQAKKNYKSAESGSTYLYIDSVTMKKVGGESNVSVYDFDLADKETGIYTVPEGAEYVDAKDKLEDIASRYASGKLNWNYQAICSSIAPDGVLPATTVRMYPENGVRLYTNEGAWIAFKIQSPGEGIRTLSLNYATSANGAKATFYILPADTTDIEKAIDPSCRVGKVQFHNADGASGYVDGNTAVIGSYRFGIEKEYILVIEATQHTPYNDHRAYLHFSQLTISEGYIEKPEDEGEKKPGSIMIDDEVVSNSEGVNFGMSAEINGHDIYFSPIDGRRMFVYDLDTMKMIDEVNTSINSPSATAIGKDGIMWLGGDSNFLFRYDPITGIGASVGSFETGVLASGSSGMNDLAMGDDGCLYFGTIKPAHIVKYDPVTRQYTDYGCMHPDANRVSTVACRNGIIYACVEGNGIHNLIKLNAETGEVLETKDISEQVGAVNYVVKIEFLDDNTFVVGANRLEKMIAVDISGEKMVLKDIGIDTGINGTISEVRDGKIYFVCYNRGLCEYDVATGKAKQIEGFEKAAIGFRFTNNTWVSVDHPDLPGESLFTYSAADCSPVLYNLETKKTVKIETLTSGYGAGQIIRGFVSSTDGSNKIYMGAYNTKNATVFDITTGTFSHYLSGGQTDSQIIYKGKLYGGIYNPARVVESDPVTGKAATVLFQLGDPQFQQDRIHTLTAGDNKIFAGTTPEKYLHGGMLAWYDLETLRTYVVVEADKVVYAEAADQTKWYDAKTNELCDFDADNDGTNEYQSFKGIIAEQTINCIVYHDGLIYGTTSTSGGTGSTARPDLSAVLFVYDVEKMELLGTYDLRESIDGLASPIFFVAGIAADPDVANNGKFWGVISETLFSYTFDKETKKFTVREELSFDKSTYYYGASRQWFPRAIQFKDGYMYIAFDDDGGMRKINMANPLDNERIMGDTPLWYVIGEDGNLYYSCNNSALNVLPLDVTAEDWAKAEAVDALIAAIGSTITVDSDAAVKAARKAYNELSWAYRALVQKLSTLEAAESDLVEAKIDAIGEVTMEDAALIGQIRADYEALNAEQQGFVKNSDKLVAAENALADLQAAADKNAADAVTKQIDAIGEVKLESEEAIKAARAAYDALTDAQKALVDAAKLTAAEAKLAELKAAAEKKAADKAAAEAVIKQIDAIGTVTLDSKAAIEAARAAYDALTAEQKALVTNLSVLTAAEAALEALEKAEDTKPEEPKPEDPPKTGETAPVAVWAVVLVASAAALSVVLVSSIRRKHA